VAESLEYDGVQVFSVAMCADGSRISSGDRDVLVRVWDAASGMAVGDELTGHDLTMR
jgi:WD40 repeat protein